MSIGKSEAAAKNDRNLKHALQKQNQKIDRYFIKKVRQTSNRYLKALIEGVGGFSGFFEPERFQRVYGKVVKDPITLKMIAYSINRYKAFGLSDWLLVMENGGVARTNLSLADEGAADWVVQDEMGFLKLNPIFSRCLNKNIHLLPSKSEKRRQYQEAYLMDRLCQMLNARLGIKECSEKLEALELIDYEKEWQALTHHLHQSISRIKHDENQLNKISKMEFEVTSFDNYLNAIASFDASVLQLDQHLETLRNEENRFKSLDMEVDVDLKPFYLIKQKMDDHLKGVNHINQMVDHLFPLARIEWESHIEALNKRYQLILNDPKRIEFYQQLNNPEKLLKSVLNDQRSRLSVRIKMLQVAKCTIDDKKASLDACYILFEKLNNRTQDIRLTEMEQAFMEQDAYDLNLNRLQNKIKTYCTYLAQQHQPIMENVKSTGSSEVTQWGVRQMALVSNLKIIQDYQALLNRSDLNVIDKIHALQNYFKKDKIVLEKAQKRDLNKETKFFIRRLESEFRQVQKKQKNNEQLATFKKIYLQIKQETDPSLKDRHYQAAIHQLKAKVESLPVEKLAKHYVDLAKSKDTQKDAMNIIRYFQAQLIQPREILLSKLNDQVALPETTLILGEIKDRTQAFETELSVFLSENNVRCQPAYIIVEKERQEIEQLKKGVPEALLNLEIAQTFQRYFQFLDITQQLLQWQEKLILQAREEPNPQALRVLKARFEELRETIMNCDPDKPWGGTFGLLPLEANQYLILSKIFDQLEREFSQYSEVRQITHMETLKTEISARSRQKSQGVPFKVVLDRAESLLNLKRLLNFKLDDQFMGAPLKNAFDCFVKKMEESASLIDQISQDEKIKLQCLEGIFKIEGALTDLLKMQADGLAILELTVQLSEIQGMLIQAYNKWVENPQEEFRMDELQNISVECTQAVSRLYKAKIDQCLECLRVNEMSKEPKDFLEWLLQVFIGVRQMLFGKTNKEEAEEIAVQKNFQQFKEIQDMRARFGVHFFKPDIEQTLCDGVAMSLPNQRQGLPLIK